MTLKAVSPDDRRTANIHTSEFSKLPDFPGYDASRALGVDPGQRPGVGFHIFKMAPGSKTTAHTHRCDEHFYIIDGDLTDHDGFTYKAGDIVMMRQGTQHWSSTVNGCVMVVYISEQEAPVD